jgi:hypothetical protein
MVSRSGGTPRPCGRRSRFHVRYSPRADLILQRAPSLSPGPLARMPDPRRVLLCRPRLQLGLLPMKPASRSNPTSGATLDHAVTMARYERLAPSLSTQSDLNPFWTESAPRRARLPHYPRPEEQFRLEGVVRPAPQLNIGSLRRAAGRERHDVVEQRQS